MLRELCDNPRLDETADRDEKSDEEEDRRPFHGVHRLLDELLAPAREQEQKEAARQRDQRGLDVCEGVCEKSENREPEDKESAL